MSFDDTNDFKVDPVRYGVLWQKVQDLEKKIDKMDHQLDELVALANKGRGGFWMGMTIASAVGGLLTWMFNHWSK